MACTRKVCFGREAPIVIRFKMQGNFASSEVAMEDLTTPHFPRSAIEFSWKHWPTENLPIDSAKHSRHVLMETFFENRNFRRILRWRSHKESSHVMYYQACKSFGIFIICLAFLLMHKVNASAITARSTARELDGESFSNCPGTFVVI